MPFKVSREYGSSQFFFSLVMPNLLPLKMLQSWDALLPGSQFPNQWNFLLFQKQYKHDDTFFKLAMNIFHMYSCEYLNIFCSSPIKLKDCIFVCFVFKDFGGHLSFFRATGRDYPCFGFLVMSALGFKVRVGSDLFTFLMKANVNVHSLIPTSGATHTDLLVAGIAVGLYRLLVFSSSYAIVLNLSWKCRI